MSQDFPEHYFKQAQSCFFRWEEDGRVLVWDDGSTIAFREELAAVMWRLAPEGLPPLNAIALLLSACRGNWPDSRHYLADLSVESKYSPLRSLLPGRPSSEALTTGLLLAKLDAIHEFPEHLRTDLRARCELAAMVFEPRSKRESWLDADAARGLAEQMASGLPGALESEGGLQQAVDDLTSPEDSVVVVASESHVLPNTAEYVKRDARSLLDALRCMQAGLSFVTAEGLERRLKTGLEDDVLPVLVNDEESSQSLIGQLLDDEELGGLARVARNLMAVLTFPRPLSQPEDVPMGGISDITNRGQLDRLLLSELAHDDLTLASRIALNEALYLHRESPPSPRSQHRRVLLDTGLCMWGIPRLFATAVALSMAEMSHADLAVEFVRFDGEELQPADFRSRDGVEGHLGALTHDLHPGSALASFFDTADSDDAEFVIVTDKDVAADSSFASLLRENLPGTPVYVVTVDRAGNLSLSSMSSRGTRILRSGQVELDSILRPRKKRRQPLRSPIEFPVLLQQKPFPLRIYQQPVEDRTFSTSLGVVMGTGDGRLMLWDRKGWGAKQLTDLLGRGRMFWCGLDPHGVPMLVWGFAAESALKLVRVHADDYVSITSLTYDGVPVRVSGHLGYVFLEFSDRWETFRSGHSECVSLLRKDASFRKSEPSVHLPQLSAASRFIRYEYRIPGVTWFALTAASGHIRLEPVQLREPDRVKALFDRDGKGIVAVYDNGDVRRLYGDGKSMSAGQGYGRLTSVSLDGTRFCLGNDSRPDNYVIETDALVVHHRLYTDVNLNSGIDACAVRVLRKNFRSISATGSCLTLRTSKGEVLSIANTDGIFLSSISTPPSGEEIEFQPVPSPDGRNYTLQLATWPCGSLAFLDSRGMLHLISHEAGVPQISLILHEGRMSGWSEFRGAFGGGYFQLSGEETAVKHDSEIYNVSIKEFIRCVNSN